MFIQKVERKRRKIIISIFFLRSNVKSVKILLFFIFCVSCASFDLRIFFSKSRDRLIKPRSTFIEAKNVSRSKKKKANLSRLIQRLFKLHEFHEGENLIDTYITNCANLLTMCLDRSDFSRINERNKKKKNRELD